MTVTILGYRFTPQVVQIPVGATVTWLFKDAAEHNVVADDNSFHSANLTAGQTFVHTFAKAGTFSYRCTLHSYMTGTVTVH